MLENKDNTEETFRYHYFLTVGKAYLNVNRFFKPSAGVRYMLLGFRSIAFLSVLKVGFDDSFCQSKFALNIVCDCKY